MLATDGRGVSGMSVTQARYLSALMATFDQLSAEQRAIIELVLKQGQEYEQLGNDARAARPAASASWPARRWCASPPSPPAAVEDDWRGQLADYLLNQQSGP